MSKITTMVAACMFLAAAFVLAPAGPTVTTAGQRASARAATHFPGADPPAPEYPAGLSAGFCVELGPSSWGPFRTRTDAEAYAGRLPLARAAVLTWCPIR